MHLNIEQIADLSKAYLNNSILNDEQLSYKIHMSECDECYEKFCTSLAVLKGVTERGLADSSSIAVNHINDELESVDSKHIAFAGMENEGLLPQNDAGLALHQNDTGLAIHQNERICLEINIYKKTLELVNKLKEYAKAEEEYWDFIKKPKLAFGRGNGLDSGPINNGKTDSKGINNKQISNEQADNEKMNNGKTDKEKMGNEKINIEEMYDTEEMYESLTSEYSYIFRKNGNLNIVLDGDIYDTNSLAVRYTGNGVEQVKEFEYDEEGEVYRVVIDENLVDKGRVEIYQKFI